MLMYAGLAQCPVKEAALEIQAVRTDLSQPQGDRKFGGISSRKFGGAGHLPRPRKSVIRKAYPNNFFGPTGQKQY